MNTKKLLNKSLSIFLCLCLILTGISAFTSSNDVAYAAETLSYESGNTTVTFTPNESDNSKYDVVVSAKADTDGRMADYISDSMPWYSYKTEITSLTISEGVSHIGNHTFQSHGADTVNVPTSVETIGKYALATQNNISCTVTIKGILTSFGNKITNNPFNTRTTTVVCFEGSKAAELLKGKSYLQTTPCWEYDAEDSTKVTKYLATASDVIIPNGVKTVGSNCFKDYTRLESVDLNGVTAIETNALSGCSNLKSITIAPAVTSIGDNALPQGITVYGKTNSAAAIYATNNSLSFVNLIPTLAKNVDASVSKIITNLQTDKIDLGKIFTNAYGSDLKYTASVDGGNETSIEGQEYSFSSNECGQHVLIFHAIDEYSDKSEQTYTVTYTVRTNSAPTIKLGSSEKIENIVKSEKIELSLSDIFADADNDPLKYYVSIDNAAKAEVGKEYTYSRSLSTGIHTFVFTANDSFDDSAEYKLTVNVYDLRLTPVRGAEVSDVSDAVVVVTSKTNGNVELKKTENGSYYYELANSEEYSYSVSKSNCVEMTGLFTYDGKGLSKEIKLSKINHLLATSVYDIHAAKGDYGYDEVSYGEGALDGLLNAKTAWSKYIGLGGFGGYLTMYYEDGIKNDSTNPYGIDFIVYGNAFAYGNSTGGEPAGVKVSEDGETWYELAGSAHYEVDTKWQQDATTKDGTKTKATLIAKQGEAGIDGTVPRTLTQFGYADVHKCSVKDNAEGDYYATGNAGNPYSSTHFDNIGDGFDLTWAVDENGIPVDVSGKEFHYIRIQNVVDISHISFGTNSTEVGTILRAVAAEKTVGVTNEPQSIKIDGVEYTNQEATSSVNGNTKYYTINLNDTTKTALEVEVKGNKGDNIFVNTDQFDETAKYIGLLKSDGSRIIRVIVQNGEKEPLIYVFNITGGGDSAKDANLSYVTLTPGDVTIKAADIDNNTFTFNVANNVEKIAINATALNYRAAMKLGGETLTDEEIVVSGTTTKTIGINEGENTFELTVTSTDGTESQKYTIKIVRAEAQASKNTISVSFTFTGDVKHGCDSNKQPLPGHEVKTWISKRTVEIPKGSTVKYITDMMLYNAGIAFDDTDGTYISDVQIPGTSEWLGEFDNGINSGWMYRYNSLIADEGYATRVLKDGDTLVWFYTDDYTKETGYEGGWDIVNKNEEVKEVTTDKAASTTTSPTDVKVSEKTNADGTKESVATVTVSADNQKEILKQAKSNKSKEIILQVSKDAVKDTTKADVQLEKSFIESIIKDTDAKLTVKTPFGDKTYTQDELKALATAATGKTVNLEIVKPEKTDEELKAEQLEAAKAAVAKASMKARSTKTAKGNVKIVFKPDTETQNFINEMKDMGYTVKYRFYRSTKKSSGYKAMLTKTGKTYTNTSGKKGTKYYYKVQVRVYDENGKCVAKTALKQCKYASRTWSK